MCNLSSLHQAFIKHLVMALKAVGSQMDESEREEPAVAEPCVTLMGSLVNRDKIVQLAPGP